MDVSRVSRWFNPFVPRGIVPSPSFMLLPVSLCCLNPLLSQGGDLGSMTDAHMPRLYLLQWLKSDRALMMLFNDGTFQVNTWKNTQLLLGRLSKPLL